jgi:uncharacterized protein (DUF1778 family)
MKTKPKRTGPADGTSMVSAAGKSDPLDRLYFVLTGRAFGQLTALLDTPPPHNPKLRRLLDTKAPWER